MEQHRPRLSQEEYNKVLEMRGKTVINTNDNTALDLHLMERGIDKSDVMSVKHWQSASGEYRFSVVTKKNDDEASLLDQFQPILKELQGYSPKFKKFKRHPTSDRHCLILNPADVHVGKLESASETGSHYNIERAVRLVDEGIDGILNKAYGFNTDKVFFVIGNDVLHTEGATGMTTKGTKQDTSGAWHEAFVAAKEMYVRAIEKILPYSDVEVIFNPSNHDYASGWMLAQVVEAYFRKCKNVTFDVSIKHRKYHKYGVNMIATSHGDGAPLDKVPLLMATESPQMWVDCPMRYAFLCHVHHKQYWKFMAGKDHIGVTVEYLRTSSGSDTWHEQSAFKGAKKAIEGFVHSYDYGQVARITHNFF